VRTEATTVRKKDLVVRTEDTVVGKKETVVRTEDTVVRKKNTIVFFLPTPAREGLAGRFSRTFSLLPTAHRSLPTDSGFYRKELNHPLRITCARDAETPRSEEGNTDEQRRPSLRGGWTRIGTQDKGYAAFQS
jgi:hypothetical protein